MSAMDEGVAREWRAVIHRIVNHRRPLKVKERLVVKERRVLIPSPDAEEVFLKYDDEVNHELEEGKWDGVEHFAKRHVENAKRIAINRHVLNQDHGESNVVSEETAFDAVRMMRYYAAVQRRVLEDGIQIGKLVRKAKLEGVLAKRGSLTFGELKRERFDEAEILRMTREYPSEFRIKDIPTGSKGGRPTKRVSLSV